MHHGYADPQLEGLKEFMGEPSAIADFIGDAKIFIDHLAPVTGGMLDRLPSLELIAVSRGGPVNIDMKAVRARGIKVVNTPGRNAPAVAEFTIGAILAETRLIRPATRRCGRGSGGAISTAPTSPATSSAISPWASSAMGISAPRSCVS